MKIPNISILDFIKKTGDIFPKANLEKIILKTLIALWVVTLIATLALRTVKGNYDSIEKRISEMATKMHITPSVDPGDVKKYEAMLSRAEYPEPESVYAQSAKRDPFSKYVEQVTKTTTKVSEHDFSLRSIGNVPLPVMYKGFIELSDKLIGQVNWKETTRFVESGTSLNGYKIQQVTKEKIDVIDEQGKRMSFVLNKPVLSDKLNALLYDRISQKTFTVEIGNVIDDYKVIDIQPDYVILLLKGAQLKLTKE